MKNKVMAFIVIGLVSGIAWAQSVEDQVQQGSQQAQQWEQKKQAMHEKMQQMKADCANDVKQFCATAEHGHDRMQCLIKNKPQLSQACQADVTKMEEFHKRHAQGAAPAPSSTN